MSQVRSSAAPAELMRNSVDTYHKAVMPKPLLARTYKKYASLALRQQEKSMVQLEPKMLGSSKPRMFYPFMAVP